MTDRLTREWQLVVLNAGTGIGGEVKGVGAGVGAGAWSCIPQSHPSIQDSVLVVLDPASFAASSCVRT